MADDESQRQDDLDPQRQRHNTLVRRAGYVVFIGGGVAMFLAMLVGVVQGIRTEKVWDPYTGLPHREGECLERSRNLMLDAGRLERLRPQWENRYRDWVVRCKDRHAEAYELLKETRTVLRKRNGKAD
jgi:hypothetical protein